MQKMTLIFDMDGVILDTESLCRRCWHALAPEYHLSDDLDEAFLASVGTTRRHTGIILRERYGADFPYEQFDRHVSRTFHAIADVEGIPLKPGARELLIYASENGFRIGLASSTRQATVEAELRQADLYRYFDYVLGGDRIARSKPFPDIYQTACRDMGIAPENAFAIEDSYNGIRAASGAGMKPIMVPDLLPPTDEMRALCHAIFPDLLQLRNFLIQTHSA